MTKVRTLLAGQPAQLQPRPGRAPAAPGPAASSATCPSGSPRSAITRSGWPPNSVTAGSPRSAPGTVCPAGRPSSRRLREAAAPHARPLTVAAGPLTVVDENADTARAIAAAAPPGTSAPWATSTPGPCRAKAMPPQVQAIIDANPRPSPRRGTVPAGAQVVLDQLAAYGTGDQVREQLQPWDHTADIVTILLPPGMPWHNIEATLQAAAPSTRPGQASHQRKPRATTR